MANFNPALTGLSRVFLLDGRARPDHEPSYQGCMMAGSLEQSFGDVERIECPSSDEYGAFDYIAEIVGGQEPATVPLTGRYALDVASELLEIARRRCAVDVQVHLGRCSDPSDFNTFKKAVIVEQARLTSWSTEDLGALASDENAVVNESTDVTGMTLYEVLPLSVTERGADVVTNPLEDVVICSKATCGECIEEDPGCNVIFAVGDAGPGSPGTAPDLIWSDNAADTLNADDITSLDAAEDADGVACVDIYVVVISNASDSYHYKTKADILAGTAGLWTEVDAGIVAAGSPMDIWSVGRKAFICGDGGYMYSMTTAINAGVTVLDAGVATTEDLNAVHALDKYFVVAVGDANSIIRAVDGESFEAIDGPADGAGDANTAVWLVDRDTWFIGNDAGEIYFTVNGGEDWTAILSSPVTFTAIMDIAFSTPSVGYVTGTIAGPAGVILRTFDGGFSWTALPEGLGNMPDNHEFRAISACPADANFVVGVGLGDDDADGIFVRGQD